MSHPTTTAVPPGAGLLTTAAATCSRTLRVVLRTPQLIGATLGQGVLFLLVFRYVFGGAIDTGDLNYIDYMTPGILTATVLFAAAGAAVGVAQDQADGFADRALSLPTSRLGLTIGRTAADTTVILAAAAVTIAVAVAVGFQPQGSPAQLAAAAGLLVAYAAGFAALFAVLGTAAGDTQSAQAFGFLAIPLTFVSSAYVPTATMPDWLAVVARHQPVTHMVNALRDLTQPHPAASTWTTSVAIAVGSSLALLVAATLATTRTAGRG